MEKKHNLELADQNELNYLTVLPVCHGRPWRIRSTCRRRSVTWCRKRRARASTNLCRTSSRSRSAKTSQGRSARSASRAPNSERSRSSRRLINQVSSLKVVQYKVFVGLQQTLDSIRGKCNEMIECRLQIPSHPTLL